MEKRAERDTRTYRIIGAAMEVHRVLGCGFLEPIYQEALGLEFERQNIPHEREPQVEIAYKGVALSKKYQPDFICFGSVVVELKALSRISSTEEAQIINYLKATSIETGLLINFGTLSLQHRRLVRSRKHDH